MTNTVAAGVGPTIRVIEAAQLVKRAQRLVEETEGVGITVPQLEALQFVGDSGGSVSRMTELTQAMEVTPTVSTGIVDRLERGGYVRRIPPDPNEDRRKIGVELTDAGWDVLRRAQDALVRL